MTIFQKLKIHLKIKEHNSLHSNIKRVSLSISLPALALLLISCSIDNDERLTKPKRVDTKAITAQNHDSRLPFNCDKTTKSTQNINSNNAPSTLSYRVVKKKKHRENAFTQGLIYHDGIIFESTGLYGHSSVSKIDYASSQVLAQTTLAKNYFGEGLTLYNNELIQLTWKSGTVFRYQLPDLTLTDSQKIEGEGWGMTTNHHELITSNGSNVLTFRNPETLEPVREVKVHYLNRPLKNLNELEWVNNCVLANVWRSDLIAIIHPKTGETLYTLNMQLLANNEVKRNRNSVTNGIAYRKDTGNLLVTGKNWRYLYEIQILPKQP